MAAVAGADPGQLRVVLKPLPGVIHHGDYVLVCPHSAISYKEWPAASWAAVAEAVMARGLEVVVASQPARERPGMPAGVRFIDVSVPGMARLIARARCVVAPDSGPVHLADALGVSVVGLYAATSTMTYGPYRDRRFCIDVHREGFPAGVRYDSSKHLGSASMSGISVDQVTALVNASTGASSG
jgi:heptosyltransferase I